MLILTIIIMAIGFIGAIVPGLPGIGLMFLSTLFYGVFTQFEKISIGWIVVFGVLMLISFILDYLSSMVTAKKFGATKFGIIGGLVGAVVGAFILNVPGLFLGQFIGMLLGEMFGGKALKASVKAGFGGIVGYILGMTINISIAFFIMAIFLFKTLR
ncbi:hypothetical protein HNQ80_000715 [Anaerosolibacter carboniphilus]|uniref:DUF456 domain-containing protein n=1 Tax=Anaerosolibacter carboniphilus TaxID=1417629 RepID=A0A841KUN5_9FIRM|nr:DUF456 domain-containing protein [Anaerosolibacter carboniphilus]MBB6214632.1 hypothetical protein [Anaerosolibacter carboniphilus]